ncbi:MAG: tRNA-intron lyase [archaeon]|nr:tRNA-intron lyase [Candidatus Micrarchaeota archaeon]
MKNLLVSDKAIVREKKVKDQLIPKGFGEKTESDYVLDLIEAYFLMEKKKLNLEDREGKKIKEEELLKYAMKRDRKFYPKFLVYSDLRERGFVVKTGFKFGFDLRVYPRGKRPGQAHTYWAVAVVSQNDRMNFIEFSRMVRLSGNIKTILLIAVVDSENDINYYEVKRLTP